MKPTHSYAQHAVISASFADKVFTVNSPIFPGVECQCKIVVRYIFMKISSLFQFLVAVCEMSTFANELK